MTKEQLKEVVTQAIDDYASRAEELFGPDFWKRLSDEDLVRDFVTSWGAGIEPGEQLN